MSFSYKNYNVAYKLFIETVAAFESFIPGIDSTKTSAPMSATPFGWIARFDTDTTAAVSDEERAAREKRRNSRRMAMQILDRTTGMYFLNDFNEAITTPGALPGAASRISRKYISLVHAGEPFASALNQDDTTLAEGVHAGPTGLPPAGFASMVHVISQVNPKKVTRKAVTLDTASSQDSGSDANLESGDKKYKVDWSGMPSHKPKSTGDILPDTIINTNISKPHRFDAPSLGALVIKDPAMNFSSKQSSHLPVFFNAVSPLEMSRCSVYLDFRLISTDQRKKAGRLNSVNFLGFPGTDSQYQMFKVNEPVDSDAPAANDLNTSKTYMDVFTSTQTMVNANSDRIGLEHSIEEIVNDLLDNAESKSNMFNQKTVIDKFQPFMTLLSADIKITGAGAALLSTKTATVNLKLHDKSRIADLAPLLSVDSFGFTKVFMEFGWSHPDASFTSNNQIGKYLNGLRDVSTYTLKNASYNFGSDNSVDITLELASIGTAQSHAIHAGAGTHSSLRMYQDLLQKSFQKIRSGLDAKKEIKTRRDLRSRLLVTSRNAGSINQLVPFKKMKNLHSTYRSVTADHNVTTAESKELLKSVLDAFGIKGSVVIAAAGSEDEFLRALEITDGELGENAARAGNLVFSKLLATTATLDPFQTACVTESDVTDDITTGASTVSPMIGFDGNSPSSYKKLANEGTPHVSLGKLICQFIAQPLATSGLYDEVQVYFYPVNNHAGAARKHTTASLPIPYQRVEDAFRKTLGAAGSGRLKNNLTVQGAFRIFDDICSDRTIPAYGIFSNSASMREFKNFKKMTYDNKKVEAFKGLKMSSNQSFNGKTEAEIRVVLDQSRGFEDDNLNNLAIRAYEKQLLETHSQELTGILRKIYGKKGTDGKDGYRGYSVVDRFVPVNLNMYLESGPAIKSSSVGSRANRAVDVVLGTLGSAGAMAMRHEAFEKGIERDKQIMRIHIYDQSASSNPEVATWLSRTNEDSEVVGAGLSDEVYQELRGKDFSYWKSLARSFYPAIIHGANSGTVLGVSVSSQTSGDLGNVMLVDAYEQVHGLDANQNKPNFDETVVFPSIIKLELMGNPMISRGQEFFIDFGTNTSLDNVYVVDNLTHTVKAGEFTTVCDMTVANQGLVSSIRSKTLSKVRALKEKL